MSRHKAYSMVPLLCCTSCSQKSEADVGGHQELAGRQGENFCLPGMKVWFCELRISGQDYGDGCKDYELINAIELSD